MYCLSTDAVFNLLDVTSKVRTRSMFIIVDLQCFIYGVDTSMDPVLNVTQWRILMWKSGLAERYIVPFSYHSARPELWIRIRQVTCLVLVDHEIEL
jgi:hypothetical protein